MTGIVKDAGLSQNLTLKAFLKQPLKGPFFFLPGVLKDIFDYWALSRSTRAFFP
jgi:hypothetical protein